MRQSNHRQFKEGNGEKTKEVFMKFLDEREAWFGHLLYGIKYGWLQNGCGITEILIREMQPTAVSVLKAYLPCYVKHGEQEFLPTKNQIIGVVQRFIPTTIQKYKDSDMIGESIDFAIQVFGLGTFRVNFSYSNDGGCLSIRYLPYDVPKLEEVGYPPIYRKFIDTIIEDVFVKSPPVMQESFFIQINGDAEMCSKNQTPEISLISTSVPRAGGGLILHIGPTGSGKTTALASEIRHIADNTAGLILTYEDPVEFLHIGTQSPVESFELGRDIKENDDFTLAEMVQRHSLRKNPAVIMFGEMRTLEQMRTVVELANRGHWVFASMHGNTVVEAISALMAIFKDEPYILSNSLKAAVAHRLATNLKGEVVPLFEIFMPDAVRTESLSKGGLDDLKRAVNENLGEQYVSFEASLQNLVESDKITSHEVGRIRKMTLGNITNKDV